MICGIMKVHDLLTRDVITARTHDSVETVRDRMAANAIHALPILDGSGKAAGLVTSTDLLSAIPGDIPITDAMGEVFYEIHSHDDIAAAARLMVRHNIHHLVVLHEGEVAGILSSLDLVKLIADGKVAV